MMTKGPWTAKASNEIILQRANETRTLIKDLRKRIPLCRHYCNYQDSHVTSMAEALIGRWNVLSVENIDAYMDALGVTGQLREMAKTTKPVIEISKDGGQWIIRTIAGDKTAETKFIENKEVDSVSLIGQQIKTTLKFEGNKMIETQRIGDQEVVIERVVEDGVYISKMRTKGVEATIKFTQA